MDFNVPLDKIEKGMLRTATGLLILFLVYSGFSSMIKNQISDKNQKTEESIKNTNAQIQLIDKDISGLKQKTSVYEAKIEENTNKTNKINKARQKEIPNLLNRLMYIMPTGVQLTSIQSTQNGGNTHIEIQAQANKYEQLGFLVANIKKETVLRTDTVISTTGQKSNGIITMKIEGDLP